MEHLFARNALDLSWIRLAEIAGCQSALIGMGQYERMRENSRRAGIVMDLIKSLYQELEDFANKGSCSNSEIG